MNTLERRKPKTPQKENINEVDGRDTFQTPNYATDLLVSELTWLSHPGFEIWECAAGLGKIARRLRHHGFCVLETDLAYGELAMNFLTQEPDFDFDAIITNPPFSLKRKFYERCVEYGKPFALLIPADYSGWTIKAIQDGAEKIIPSRRIDYITPNILNRVHEGEVFELLKKDDEFDPKWNLPYFKAEFPNTWNGAMVEFEDYHNYISIHDAPAHLLRKYSSSYYHSMWLTQGFNLGRTETFVELTNEMKDNI